MCVNPFTECIDDTVNTYSLPPPGSAITGEYFLNSLVFSWQVLFAWSTKLAQSDAITWNCSQARPRSSGTWRRVGWRSMRGYTRHPTYPNHRSTQSLSRSLHPETPVRGLWGVWEVCLLWNQFIDVCRWLLSKVTPSPHPVADAGSKTGPVEELSRWTSWRCDRRYLVCQFGEVLLGVADDVSHSEDGAVGVVHHVEVAFLDVIVGDGREEVPPVKTRREQWVTTAIPVPSSTGLTWCSWRWGSGCCSWWK